MKFHYRIQCKITTSYSSSKIMTNKKRKSPGHFCHEDFLVKKTAATYSPALRCSTIGAHGLNFSVRDGKRWNPEAITA